MDSGIKFGLSTLYVSDGETFKEFDGTPKEMVVGIDYANGKDEYIETIINGEMTLTLKPTHKEWFKKKKGNRYVRSYKLKEGMDLKVFNKLFGGE